MANPEFEAWGSKRMRFIEKGEPGEFRDAKEYLHGLRIANTIGYYCDEFGDVTVVPAVFIDRAPGSQFTYYAAVRDPYNDDDCGVVDFEDTYTDPEEAARAAHGLAERYAEKEREYNENESNKTQLENLQDDVRELRDRHRYLIRALPATGDDATGARMREEVRTRMGKLAKDIRELRSTINWSM